jgi:pyrroloquinoline-quinone synthase
VGFHNARKHGGTPFAFVARVKVTGPPVKQLEEPPKPWAKVGLIRRNNYTRGKTRDFHSIRNAENPYPLSFHTCVYSHMRLDVSSLTPRTCDPPAPTVILESPEVIMETKVFLSLLEERIRQYDLLCHPFYKAWSSGELTRDDLRAYAEDYYPHVEAFPGYLAQLGVRLEQGELRRAVLANMTDEKGGEDSFGEPERSHSELWLDFVEGVGGSRVPKRRPVAEVRMLISWFHQVASEGTPEEALAAFYAYESQVPRVAQEKDRVLRELYLADEKTCGYFTLHATADVHHAQVWRTQLEKRVKAYPETAEKALASAETAAKALWTVLDRFEARRLERTAALA